MLRVALLVTGCWEAKDEGCWKLERSRNFLATGTVPYPELVLASWRRAFRSFINRALTAERGIG